MEVITIDSEAYRNLLQKIDLIADYVVENDNLHNAKVTDDTWVDSYEVCTFLRISDRTLQRLRTNGTITYSIISGKTYYTIGEIKRLLKERLIKSDEDNLAELMLQHQTYQEQRRKDKPKKDKL